MAESSCQHDEQEDFGSRHRSYRTQEGVVAMVAPDAVATTINSDSKASLGFIMDRRLARSPVAAAAAVAGRRTTGVPHGDEEQYTPASSSNQPSTWRRASPRIAAQIETSRSTARAKAPRTTSGQSRSSLESYASVQDSDSDATLSDPEIRLPPPEAASGGTRKLCTKKRHPSQVSSARPKPTARRGKANATPPMSEADKRLSRECRVDGCSNYIFNKGVCFRHGVRAIC